MSTLRSLTLAALLLSACVHTARAADADARCRYVKTLELPVRYAGGGLAPAVEGSINGKPATLLLDTGSFQSLLTMTGVVRRAMPLHWTMARVAGVGGESRLYAAHIDDMSLGPARLNRGFDMAVIGDTASAFEFDALLGAPFLLRTDMMLDLRARRVAFYKPQNCEKQDLFLWEENTIVVPFRRGPRDGEDVANPHFTVLVNGKRLNAEIDSGAHRSFMTLAAAEHIGIDVKGPKAVRMGDSQGIGSDRAPRWIVPVQSVQISDETVENVELGVVDVQSDLDTELFLGQDFLRAHRVLFAMSQEKLYLAYLGGDVFTRGTSLEPWMRQEAEAGNPDAQYALARFYGSGSGNGRGVARDPAQMLAWLEKAAAGGQPNANLALGRGAMQDGRYADAIPKLRAALDRLPAERYGALWLYVARLHAGQADVARRELEASSKGQDGDEWPLPLAQYYLGKWDAKRVLEAAAKTPAQARERRCEAHAYMAELRTAQGDAAGARQLLDSVRGECEAGAATATAPANGPR